MSIYVSAIPFRTLRDVLAVGRYSARSVIVSGQRKMQVFLTTGVVALDAKLLVADRATGGDRRVVYPWRRVFQHFEDGSAPIGPKYVAGNRGE